MKKEDTSAQADEQAYLKWEQDAFEVINGQEPTYRHAWKAALAWERARDQAAPAHTEGRINAGYTDERIEPQEKSPAASVGDWIKRTRKSRGWSQAELAEKVGLSRQSINYIESGTKDHSYSSIKDIVAALGGEITLSLTAEGESIKTPKAGACKVLVKERRSYMPPLELIRQLDSRIMELEAELAKLKK